MPYPPRILLLTTLAGFAGMVFTTANPSAYQPKDKQSYLKHVVPFFEDNCLHCHGPDRQKGDLRLDTLGLDFSESETAFHWTEIMDNINLGEMPPPDEPRPFVDESTRVTTWIAGELRHAEKSARATGGRVQLRRLNRFEYTNTVTDLLDIRFFPETAPDKILPPDGEWEGFDKVSAALSLDSTLMDRYFEVAMMVADLAIVEGPPETPTQRLQMELEGMLDYLCKKAEIECRDDGIIIRGKDVGTRTFGLNKGKPLFPADGWYRISFRAAAHPGDDGEPVQVNVSRSSEGFTRKITVDAPPGRPEVYSFVLPLEARGGGEINISLVDGASFTTGIRAFIHFDREIREHGKKKEYDRVAEFRARSGMEGITARSMRSPESVDSSNLKQVFIDWVAVEGPLYEQWPPKSHELIFFKGEDAEKTIGYAREIFDRLLPRAWRRETTTAEREKIVSLVQQELNLGKSFEQAVRVGLIATLTSPNFIFHYEPEVLPPYRMFSDAQTGRRIRARVLRVVEPSVVLEREDGMSFDLPLNRLVPADREYVLNLDATDLENQKRPLNPYEVASRLSYFLWGSMPDERLFNLAARGQLRDSYTLRREVDRMLADPKAERFQEDFATQWLRIDEFRAFDPDRREYKEYTDALGEAMEEETLRFFQTILSEDLSLLNFLDSNFTVINGDLASLYGIDGVEGKEFRKVALPADSARGGILGHAGVHLLGSDGIRTLPVTRAVYVLEVLFNDPPNPPPPNVGELEPAIRGEKLSVRERLEQHQQIEQCAACHQRLDPYGIAMENFDVIGRWRTKQNGEGYRSNEAPDINPSGRLPNGVAFATFDEFKAALVKQEDRFVRAFTEKMMTYALGRAPEPSDRQAIDGIVAGVSSGNNTAREVIKGIVTSQPFLTK